MRLNYNFPGFDRNELFNTGLEEQRRKMYGDPEEQQRLIKAACKEVDISYAKFN